MDIPGSKGEHDLQAERETVHRALAFYQNQMLDQLNATMQEFISTQQMVFIATADSKGECDSSFRFGLPGFVRIADAKSLAYPEYRGNGVLASMGNIRENPHIGIIFIDFFESTIGLHVNGKAAIKEHGELLKIEKWGELGKEHTASETGRKPECWVVVEVEEAYIHCSKHIPLLKKLDKKIHWGTDKENLKGGDFFKAKTCDRPWGEE